MFRYLYDAKGKTPLQHGITQAFEDLSQNFEGIPQKWGDSKRIDFYEPDLTTKRLSDVRVTLAHFKPKYPDHHERFFISPTTNGPFYEFQMERRLGSPKGPDKSISPNPWENILRKKNDPPIAPGSLFRSDTAMGFVLSVGTFDGKRPVMMLGTAAPLASLKEYLAVMSGDEFFDAALELIQEPHSWADGYQFVPLRKVRSSAAKRSAAFYGMPRGKFCETQDMRGDSAAILNPGHTTLDPKATPPLAPFEAKAYLSHLILHMRKNPYLWNEDRDKLKQGFVTTLQASRHLSAQIFGTTHALATGMVLNALLNRNHLAQMMAESDEAVIKATILSRLILRETIG